MSEHEELKEQLDRIEIKQDLILKALGFRASKDCEDPYHKRRQKEWLAEVCPTCDDYSRNWHLKKISDDQKPS